MVSARRKKLKLLVRLWKEAHHKGHAYTLQEAHYRRRLRHNTAFTTVNGALAGTLAVVGAIVFGKSDCGTGTLHLGLLITLAILGYGVSTANRVEGNFDWRDKERGSHLAATNWDEVDQQIEFFFTDDLSDDQEVKQFARLMNERVYDLKADSIILETVFAQQAREQLQKEPPRNLYNGNGNGNGNGSNGNSNGSNGNSNSNSNSKGLRRQPTLPSLVQRRNRKNGIVDDLDVDISPHIIDVDDLVSDDASDHEDDDYDYWVTKKMKMKI